MAQSKNLLTEAVYNLDDQSPYSHNIDLVYSKVSALMWQSQQGQSIQNNLGKSFSYTLQHNPRQWPGSMAFLLTNGDSASLFECLSVAAIWNLFYIYDDVEDKKTTRYGIKTALGVFGRKSAFDSWQKAHSLSEYSSWQKSFKKIVEAQARKLRVSNLDDYIEQIIERLVFINDWWIKAALTSHDLTLKKFIEQSLHLLKITAQMRNDLKNTDNRETTQGGQAFSDFYNARPTFVTLPVLESRYESWVRDNIWGKNNINEKQKLTDICEELNILTNLSGKISVNIIDLKNLISRSGLTENQKVHWQAHIYRHFEVHVTAPYDQVLPEESTKLRHATLATLANYGKLS